MRRCVPQTYIMIIDLFNLSFHGSPILSAPLHFNPQSHETEQAEPWRRFSQERPESEAREEGVAKRPRHSVRAACGTNAAGRGAAGPGGSFSEPHVSARPLRAPRRAPVRARANNPAVTGQHGEPRQPLQDRGGRGHAVWEDGAPARLRQGLLPGGESSESSESSECRRRRLLCFSPGFGWEMRARACGIRAPDCSTSALVLQVAPQLIRDRHVRTRLGAGIIALNVSMNF